MLRERNIGKRRIFSEAIAYHSRYSVIRGFADNYIAAENCNRGWVCNYD